MSQSYPPPPQGGNPYGQQQPQPQYGQQQPQGGYQQPGGFPQQPGGFGGGYPPPAPLPPARSNVGLGILAGVVVMLVAAAAYGGIIKATEHEIGYAALAVGALVGAALGKAGGRNPVLPVIGIPLALLGVYLGQIFGITLLLGASPDAPGIMTILTDHFDIVQQAWKESLGGMDILFFGIAGVEGFVVAKRVAG
ncbi:hypothetical protein QMK19_11290 [Streptomyces sp. H10-C2]|uniref:hypothetical protein n=1 Tax=unclassified Streptomyces TaxID=2593676 RepID=UPI0024BB03F8|nr:MULTISPECIES: hypothetical protein [unclassified Streptomyces]MDJ0340594.1 hypothetical protein [Streptomyces sp. PH10-H1]MDJ0370242.1 hypothetical protein [Streptomyces sp. H10-C2]